METSDGVVKCRLFSQANLFEVGKEEGTQRYYKFFRRAAGPFLLAVSNTVAFKLAPALFSPIF